MRIVFAAMLGTLVILAGCDQGTTGGPGATGPDADKATVGRTDETFSLDVPMTSTKVTQGETTAVSIGIKRGTNMDGDVTLEFAGLPEGVSIEPANAAIRRQDTEAKLTLRASHDASLGDFTIKVTGHPPRGRDAVNDLKITVAERDAETASTETTRAQREEYAAEARNRFDELDARYEDLKARAARAEGDAKRDLEMRVAQAKVKRDVAAERLDELQPTSADRWEQGKESLARAFDDLKRMFD